MRVLLCGILTGGVWNLLALLVVVVVLGETDFVAAIEAARASRPAFPALPFLLNIAMGIWAIWLYAAIRPHFGPGPKTAALAGFALWVIASLEISKVGAVGLISPSLLPVPVAAALPVVVGAVLVGAWPYKQ